MTDRLQSSLGPINNDHLTLEQDARTATVLRKIIDHNLKKILKNQLKGMDGQITGETVLIEGATGAVTVQIDSRLQFMIKFDPETVPREIDGYHIMTQVLPKHTLSLYASDSSSGLLCLPYKASAMNLHDIIKDKVMSDSDVKSLYSDFLRKMQALWLMNYKPVSPDYESRFVKRLHQRTRRAERLFSSSVADQQFGSSELLRLPLLVNGKNYPPMMELLDLSVQLISDNRVTYSTTAHGDEHAKNILVETSGVERGYRWYLIDLPNVNARADWVWSIAKMRHWWTAYYYIDLAKHSQFNVMHANDEIYFEADARRAEIKYSLESQIPLLCHDLDQKVETLAQQTGKVFGDSKWRKRYAASLFLVFYGGIPYHRNCQQMIPILVGEAAKALLSEVESDD
jgi:hypothetical protein